MYLVQSDAGHEHYCTCPDWEHRQSKVNAPCKHILSAQLQAERTQTTEPAAQPAARPRPERKRSKLLEWQDEDEADARAAWDGPQGGNPFNRVINLPEAS